MPRRHLKSPFPLKTALPTTWLMTDERVPRNALLRAIRRLPARGGVVLRHYSWSDDERRTLLDEVRAATRGRRICLVLAGTEKLAGKWGADGWHGTPSRRERRAVGRDHALIRTAAVHNMAQLRDAGRAQVDLIFVSPLFRTRSHPGAVPLGSVRFAAIARQAKVPVIALGGVRPAHRIMIARLGAAGLAAIDGLVRRR